MRDLLVLTHLDAHEEAGLAMGELLADLTAGWALLRPEHQEHLANKIHRRRPHSVYLEPPCTCILTLWIMNWKHMPRHVRDHWLTRAISRLEFGLLSMRIQLLAGRACCAVPPRGGNLVDAPTGSALPRGVPADDLPGLTDAGSGW